jgi:Ni,Fe-hydrogenase I large subunit
MEESSTSPVHPEIEAAVLHYMKANPKLTRYYWHMMRQNPERALQEIMCRKMSRMQELEKLADRLMPLVKEWVEQTPGLHKCIEHTLKTKVLFPSVAYIEEAVRMKESMSPTPLPGRMETGVGV